MPMRWQDPLKSGHLDEIRKNRGRLYDRAADACLRLFTEKTFTFTN